MKNTNKKWKVLVTAPYLQPVVDNYQNIFDEHQIEIIVPHVNERMSEEELLACISDIDGILCGDDRITENVLAHAPKLKVISKWGTGIDSIDKEAATRRGIPVKNTVNAFTEPVADTVLGLILCFSRGILDLNTQMHEGKWVKQLKWSLSEKTLGVVGIGNIGKAVIKRAQAFGMKILANDIKDVPGFELVSLEKLLQEADFVSLNCDLNSTSRHLMDRSRFALMRPTAVLINTSRGPVVDEAALIEALQKKQIAGAGIDVFEEEPLSEDNPLKKMANVVLSPHNANAGSAAWTRVHENTINNLVQELEKKDGKNG